MGDLYPCPCCGYLVFNEGPGSYGICHICWWEDDFTQLRFAAMSGGANHVSLLQAQKNFADFKASDPRLKETVRPPGPEDKRDPRWRPLDPAIDRILEEDPSGKPGWPVGEDLTSYYYWKSDAARK